MWLFAFEMLDLYCYKLSASNPCIIVALRRRSFGLSFLSSKVLTFITSYAIGAYSLATIFFFTSTSPIFSSTIHGLLIFILR